MSQSRIFVVTTTLRDGWVSAGCADHLGFAGGQVKRNADGSVTVENRDGHDVARIAEKFRCDVVPSRE